MTTPVAPPISLQDIQAEFGGGGSLISYVAGGAYVVAGTRNGANVLIPSAPPISILDFLGTTKVIQIFDLTVGTTGGPFPLLGFSSPAALNFGAISPATFIPNATDVDVLYWNTSDNNLWFGFEVAGLPNSGWTTMTINGNAFSRAAATFNNVSFGETTWRWVGADPFPGIGTHVDIIFT